MGWSVDPALCVACNLDNHVDHEPPCRCSACMTVWASTPMRVQRDHERRLFLFAYGLGLASGLIAASVSLLVISHLSV